MNFQLFTRSGENFSASLLEPNKLYHHSSFRKEWDVVMVVTGWNSNINKKNDALNVLYDAYYTRDVNFVVI